MPRYHFTQNDPYDRKAPIELIVPALIPSQTYMASIRQFEIPEDAIAIWFLGQNGFLLKAASGPLIGIDLYLTDSCATASANSPFRVHRQLPIFIEPEDLDVDVFLTTHSHDDHADPETISRLTCKDTARFIGPWETAEKYKACGVPASSCELLHPNQTLNLGNATQITGTFALPTDGSDLNHTGALIRFANSISFYNTGDTAYCDLLDTLLPRDVDICTICINGGYNNLNSMQAARILRAIQPKVAVPCHYDMMVHNIAHPDMLRTSLEVLGCDIPVKVLDYYAAWVYSK